MGYGQHEVKATSADIPSAGLKGKELVLGLDILFAPYVSGRTPSEGASQLHSNNNVGFTTMPPCRPATSNWLSMAHLGRASHARALWSRKWL
jgi:hypothetical protein